MNLMEVIPWKGQSDTSKKLTIIAKIIRATSEILDASKQVWLLHLNLIHFQMYHFEKRSMKNKLLAQICKALVITDILSTPVFTWRFLVGPVNAHLSIFIGLVRNINSVIVFLCFMEIIAFKFLMLYGWKHFNSTNEEFMFVFVNVSNTFFAFTTQISRWLLGKYNHNLQSCINQTITLLKIIFQYEKDFLYCLFAHKFPRY